MLLDECKAYIHTQGYRALSSPTLLETFQRLRDPVTFPDGGRLILAEVKYNPRLSRLYLRHFSIITGNLLIAITEAAKSAIVAIWLTDLTPNNGCSW
jgi:hypothetical protein